MNNKHLCVNWSIKKLDSFCLKVHDVLRVLGRRWDYIEWKLRFKPETSEASAARAWEHLKKGLLEAGLEFSLVNSHPRASAKTLEYNSYAAPADKSGRSSIQFQSERGVVEHVRNVLGYDYHKGN